MATRHETKAYRLESDRFGFFTLTRLGDGASAFFQGDDATLWDRDMTAIEGVKVWNAGNTLDKSFDFLCSGYDEILEIIKAAPNDFNCPNYGACSDGADCACAHNLD